MRPAIGTPVNRRARGTFPATNAAMIKRTRRRFGQDHGTKHGTPEDVVELLSEWKRRVLSENIAAKHRRLLDAAAPVHPSSLDEITVVTRIGRIRLPRKITRSK